MQHPDADLIIVGAGAAGLSLAVRLSLDGHCRSIRTILLEPRSEYVRDRTWCFWNVIDHPFEDCVSHRWSTWRVMASSPSRRIDRSWPQLSYQHLPSDAFYAKAIRLLERESNIELRLGVRVNHLEQTSGTGERVEVSTDSGTLRARLVVDTRPRGGRLDASPSIGSAGRLVQHFHGQTVRVDRPAFDPGVATVMDFLDGGTTGIHFMYLLPYDDRTALVEDTWFSAEPRPVERYREEISAYLSERHGIERYEELHAETGAIPMDPNPLPPPAFPRILDAGVRGGAARPSTGYAFLAIQRQAERLAKRLADWAQDPTRDPPPSPRYYSPRSSFLDRVFVSHIARHPESAPDLFLRMFDRVRPDSMVRFLFDGGRLADDLRVMAALPAGPLIAETIRQYGP